MGPSLPEGLATTMVTNEGLEKTEPIFVSAPKRRDTVLGTYTLLERMRDVTSNVHVAAPYTVLHN